MSMRSRLRGLEDKLRGHSRSYNPEDIRIIVSGTEEEVDHQIAEEMAKRRRMGIPEEAPGILGVILTENKDDGVISPSSKVEADECNADL